MNQDSSSKNIANVLERTAVRAHNVPIDEIIPAFDDAETECLQFAPSEELKLEVRRRVAEWKMNLLCERNGSFGVVENLYKDLLALGYTNLEIEGTIQIQFAQYCERQGLKDYARQILQNFLIRLDVAPEAKDLETAPYFCKVQQHLKAATEKLLSKIDE